MLRIFRSRTLNHLGIFFCRGQTILSLLIFFPSQINATPFRKCLEEFAKFSPDEQSYATSGSGKPSTPTAPSWLNELTIPAQVATVKSGQGWQASSPQGARIPIGWTPEHFQKFMDKILTDAAFKDADMVVLYGSGMNQNVGHRPSAAESDSDVHVIFPDSVYVGGASDAPHWMPVNNALSEIGPQMGLAPGMLGMDFLPKHTKDALSPSEPGKLNTFSSLLPKGEEKKNWEDLLTKARSEGWSRRTLKQHFYERFGYGFKPDDLIIVKTPQRKEGDLSTNEIVKALSGNGYTNIVIAK